MALPVATVLTLTYSLPVAVADLTTVDPDATINVRATGRISTVPFIANLTRDPGATTLRVDVSLANLANLTTAAATIDLFLTLWERLP